MLSIAYIFIGSFVLVLLLTPLIIKGSVKLNLFDLPGRFKIHAQPVPKIGGLAFYVSFGIVVFYLLFTQPGSVFAKQLTGLFLAGTVVAVISLVDDLWKISPFIRIICQLVSGIILVLFGIKIGLLPDYLSIPLTILWVVGIENAFNLIDGLDGLAAGLALIASAFFMFYGLGWGMPQLALIAAIVAGSTLAFLIFNFYPAKTFMGDIGSIFLGFCLSSMGVMATLNSVNLWQLFVPLLILGVPIMDTSLSIIRRAWYRKPLFDGDREHLYDLLMFCRGLSHRLTVLVFWAAGVIFGVTALLIVAPGIRLAQVLLILSGMAIVLAFQNIWSRTETYLNGSNAPQNAIPLSRPTLPDLREIKEELEDVFYSGQLTNAAYVRQLEEKAAEYLAVKHAVAVANCTSGLMLLEKALNLSGEVIVPSFTFAATAHSLLWNNLKPVFVDCDPETYNIDPKLIEEKITKQTSAILAVYISGLPPEIEALERIAEKHNLRLIFDAAHAFGSKYHNKPAGGFGDAEVFSLSPTKTVVAGEGGIVATNNDELARKIKIGRDYGSPGNYDCEYLGLSARMSELHAVLGIKNLERLEKNIAKRLGLVELYKNELSKIPGIKFQEVPENVRSTYKDFSILVDPREFGMNRDKLAQALEKEGVSTKKYYSPPVHLQKIYKPYYQRKLPTTERIARNILNLPLYSHMRKEEVLWVCRAVRRIRESRTVSDLRVEKCLAGKTILITGAAGSIGRELSFQMAKYDPAKLILIDRDENRTHDLRLMFKERYPEMPFISVIMDIKNEKRMREIFCVYEPQIIFHAAAYKHVPLMEEHPYEAVENNVYGTMVMAKLARERGAEKFVLVSSDKAVKPQNVMGASKRVAEMILQNVNGRSATRFVIVRFGNVLESNGSALPLFKEQIAKGGPVTITHPDMKRYFMTIEEAVELIIAAAVMGQGGETYLLDMGKPARIIDVARELIRKSGKEIEIKIIGARPGESLNEYLYLQDENLEGTQHPKILVSKNGFTKEGFDKDLQDLLELVSDFDEEKIKQKLLKMCDS